jgi:hypothetical protein
MLERMGYCDLTRTRILTAAWMMLRSTLFNPKILPLELDRLCARGEGRTKDCTHARNAGLRVEERQIVAEIP